MDDISTALYGDLSTKVLLLDRLKTLTDSHYKAVMAEVKPWNAGDYVKICRAHRTCWAMAKHRALKEMGLTSADLEVIEIWGTEKTPPYDTDRGKDLG